MPATKPAPNDFKLTSQTITSYVGLADNLCRIARGDEPRGEIGHTPEQLQERADRILELLRKFEKSPPAEVDQLIAILPRQFPPVGFGGQFADSYHAAAMKLIRRVVFLGRLPFGVSTIELAKLPSIEFGFAVEALRRELEFAFPPPEFYGNGRYRVGEQELRLDGMEANVLEAIVNLRSATKSQLVVESGVNDAPRVLKGICNKFPQLAAAIRMAGRKGNGGYGTTIIDKRPAKAPL